MKNFLLKLLITVLGNLLAPLYSYFLGKKNEENRTQKETLAQINQANVIRNRLNCDNSFAKRLRKKFSR